MKLCRCLFLTKKTTKWLSYAHADLSDQMLDFITSCKTSNLSLWMANFLKYFDKAEWNDENKMDDIETERLIVFYSIE